MTFICLLLALNGLFAQEGAVAAGGDAFAPSGSVSYSIGQPFFRIDSANGIKVHPGVQQPYEISIVTGVELEPIQLNLSVFPNPTNGRFTLRVDYEDLRGFNYQLTDLHGRVIIQDIVRDPETTINLEGMAKATYFLTVRDYSSTLKAFKIIKQ